MTEPDHFSQASTELSFLGRIEVAGQLRLPISHALVDLLSIDSLTDAQIGTILDRAEGFFTSNRQGRSSAALAGRNVFNVFYENSTRTAMSFATAAHRRRFSGFAFRRT